MAQQTKRHDMNAYTQMDNAEKRQMAEIQRLRDAIDKTDSEKLRRDYAKGIKRLLQELLEYRELRYGKTAQGNRP